MNIKLIFFLLPAVLLSACSNSSVPASSEQKLVLFDFSSDIARKKMVLKDATAEIIQEDDRPILQVYTGDQLSKPGLILHEPEGVSWDLNGYYQVQADVSNTSTQDMQVEMYVGNDPDGLTRWYCSDYIDLKPGEAGTITVALSWTPWVHKPQTAIAGMRGIPGRLKTDIDAIKQVSFFSRYATAESSFQVHEVRAVGQLEERDTTGFFPFVDAFGQYIHRDWKDKTTSVESLKQADEKERRDIEQHPAAPDRNQFGGWATGPQLEATGYFRTEKQQGKWWMVDPEGRLFWSAGINCVITNFGLTGIEDREHYFDKLPEEDSPLGQFYKQGGWASHGFYKDKVPFDAYNFYEANLFRKYGENWKATYQERIHDRFDSWGMNTFGNVSDQEAAKQQKTPYAGTIWIRNTPKIEGSSGFWGKFHDVFDPGFRQAVRASMEAQQTGADDPWCIGFFVDNELSWGDMGSLAIGTLKSPAEQAAKKEFVQDVKEKYKTIAALNSSWSSNYTSWEHLLSSTTPPDRTKAAVDLNIFYTKIANTYFRIIQEELNRIAPNHLYLGCRFAWANNEATMRAAARYCDIVSFNKYEYSVEKVGLPEGEDKPIMIGEFHFGALDRGSFHPGVKSATSQEDRGIKYQEYIQGALRNPAMVGAHWFQYTDQMCTGREDGENYNVGFVDVCDVPYEEFVQKVRETNYNMYEYRSDN